MRIVRSIYQWCDRHIGISISIRRVSEKEKDGSAFTLLREHNNMDLPIELKGEVEVISYQRSLSLLTLRRGEVVNGILYKTDVVFSAVYYLNIPTGFIDLTITNTSSPIPKRISKGLDPGILQSIQRGNLKLFVLTSPSYIESYIVAGNIEISSEKSHTVISSELL